MYTVAYEDAERAYYEWAGLADQVGADPFLHPGWFDAWRAAFGDRGFRLLTARHGDRLAAVLPVETARAGLLRSPTGLDTPRYGSVAANPLAALAIGQFLAGEGPRRVDLSYVVEDDPLLAARQRAVLKHHIAAQPYVDLSVAPDAYDATLPGKLRSELRRRRRRLDEQGGVEFAIEHGVESLEEGFAVEAAGWKGEQGSAIASIPERRRFYTELARWAAARGWLRLAFLRVGGRAAAFSMFLRTPTHVWALKLGVDPAFRNAGAGQLLTWESLRHWMGRGLESFEFLGGADPFKLTWTSTTRDVFRVQLFNSSMGGVVESALWRNKALLDRVPRVARG